MLKQHQEHEQMLLACAAQSPEMWPKQTPQKSAKQKLADSTAKYFKD